MTAARSRAERVLGRRLADDRSDRVPEELVVEEPMEIRLDDHLVATTMRTPGHDFELAVGFLLAEGMVTPDQVTSVRYCATGTAVDTDWNVVTVETGGQAPIPTPRVGTTTSSCGFCGSRAIEDLTARLAPRFDRGPDPAVLAQVVDRVRPQQELFDRTGGSHAAAAFDEAGVPYLVREDIGRHNAVDKIVGRLVLDGRLPGADQRHGLFVSGRASFELVQKAWAAGFSALVAVSAPSALAVRTANQANLTLAGFAREGRLTLYAGPSLDSAQ